MLYVKGSDTSKAAAESVEVSKEHLKKQVLNLIEEAGPDGLTCDEVEQYLDLRHQTASARVRELTLENKIKDTGSRRRTRSGRTAGIYATNAFGVAA